jgi:hypothetical protein
MVDLETWSQYPMNLASYACLATYGPGVQDRLLNTPRAVFSDEVKLRITDIDEDLEGIHLWCHGWVGHANCPTKQVRLIRSFQIHTPTLPTF